MVFRKEFKHKPSTLARRKRRRIMAKNTTRNTRQAGWWATTCAVHGVKSPGMIAAWIKTPTPRHQRDVMRGCPRC